MPLELNVVWFVPTGDKRFGPFFSREGAEEEAYRVGSTEIEERYDFGTRANGGIRLAVIRPFRLCKAKRRANQG